MRNKLRNWLGFGDLDQTIVNMTVSIANLYDENRELKEQLKKATTTFYTGNSLNFIVDKLERDNYAIKNFLDIEVIDEDKEDTSWTEMNKRYIKVPKAVKRSKK